MMLYCLCLAVATVVSFVSGQACVSEQPSISAPHQNVWLGLSESEMKAVAEFIRRAYPQYNFTTAPGTSRDNTISQIELLQPNKTDVLPYLDKASKAPTRYAKVGVIFGAPDVPYYAEYMVGPLPVTNSTRALPLTFPYNNAHPGRIDVPPALIGTDLVEFAVQQGNNLKDIMKTLWNSTIDDGISFRVATPFQKEGNRTVTWAGFVNAPVSTADSLTLLPLNLFARLDLTGRNSSQWAITGLFYDGVFYSTIDALRKAISKPGFVPLPINVDGNWTSTDRQGEVLPFDDLPPPVPVSSGKKRFALDAKEQYVSWMDFTFYLTVTRDTGLALYDIRYKGERLIYELGLQEALTHYAGSDPVVSSTTFLDSLGGFGPSIVSLVHGYDCPTYATYLNASWSDGEELNSQPDSICIFESQTDYPLRRHTSRVFNYTSVTKNVELKARSVFSIGNYDFMLTYTFSMDGTIEVSVRASGYIQAAYYAGNEEYGFKIHDALSGSMHDHVLNFKADFDILGTKNSVQKVEFVPATVEYPWAKGRPRNTMKAAKSFVSSEAQLNWAPNDAAIYAVVNKDVPNKFGEYRGYRIRPSGTIHLTVQNSTNAVNAGHFTQNDLYFTRQKNTEPRAASANNFYDTSNPLVDFAKFFNGESIDQQDLVAWFNLGMHHIPHTGDLPNTIFTLAHTSVLLEPFNYFESNPVKRSNQQIRLNFDGETVTETDTFGQQTATCSVNMGGDGF